MGMTGAMTLIPWTWRHGYASVLFWTKHIIYSQELNIYEGQRPDTAYTLCNEERNAFIAFCV